MKTRNPTACRKVQIFPDLHTIDCQKARCRTEDFSIFYTELHFSCSVISHTVLRPRLKASKPNRKVKRLSCAECKMVWRTWHATNNVDKLYATRGNAARPLGAACHRSDADFVSVSAFCSLPLFALFRVVVLATRSSSSDILLIYAFYALDMQFSCSSCRLLLMTWLRFHVRFLRLSSAGALSVPLRLVCCRLSR